MASLFGPLARERAYAVSITLRPRRRRRRIRTRRTRRLPLRARLCSNARTTNLRVRHEAAQRALEDIAAIGGAVRISPMPPCYSTKLVTPSGAGAARGHITHV